MPLIQTSAPAAEPLVLADVKNYLRVDADLTNDDALITMMIGAARRYAEHYTGRSFITQQWRLVMDSFPGQMQAAYAMWGQIFGLPANGVLFEKGPVQSVDSIVYTAMDGTTQTIATPGAPNYAVDLSDPVPRMTPGFGRVWPIPLPQIGAVAINFTAGYGATAASVPEGIRDWMLMRIKSRYDTGGEVTAAQRGKIEPLPWVDSMLDPYRVVWL